MFECTTLETIKRDINNSSLKRTAGFYEPSSLKEFINSVSEEAKERVFTISNPSIFLELLNPLLQLNSLHMPEKLPDSPSFIYKLNEPVGSQRVSIVSMQSLIMLSDIIDDPILRGMLSSFVFLEKRVTSCSTLLSTHQPYLNSKNVIANPSDIFKKYDKVLKVFDQSCIGIFEGYRKLLANFAKGFKFVCKKENEEDLFFETADYFLNTFPNHRTVEETVLNKIYANVLAFGYVLENRILKAFEKSRMLFKGRRPSKIEEAECKEKHRKDGVYIGRLSFRIIQNDFELNEYEDLFEEIDNYDHLRLQEYLVDEAEDTGDIDTNNSKTEAKSEKKNHQVSHILKLSETLSESASTSESSAESENSKGKRKHRKRGRKNKKKNSLKYMPEDYINDPSFWHFQNWLSGACFK